MHVTINGETRQLPAPMSVAQLVEHLKLDTRKLAVERNLAIVPRSRYAETALSEGDRIELVSFIGGG